MKTFLALLMFLTAGLLQSQDAKSPLNGTWKPVKVLAGGQTLPDAVLQSITLTLKDNTYDMNAGEQSDKGSITYDLTAKPPRLKIEGAEGPNKGKVLLAIYELKGKDLTICYDGEGKEYPKEFKSPEGSKLLLITYKKEK